MAADPQKLKARLAALKGQRQLHEHVWRDCCDYSKPELGSGFSLSQTANASEIQSRKNLLLDGTASDALDTLVVGGQRAGVSGS